MPWGVVTWLVAMVLLQVARSSEGLATFVGVLLIGGVGGVCLFLVARKAWRAVQP